MNSLAHHASQLLRQEEKPQMLRPAPINTQQRLFPSAATQATAAQQLYMALLDAQMSTGKASSAAPLLFPAVLSSQLAAHLASVTGHTTSTSSSPSTTVAKRNIAKVSRSSTASPHTSAAKAASSKRGKKTIGRICAECRTENTLQWRLGPDGQASLCNACGQRFQRRRQAQQQQQTQQQSQRQQPGSPQTTGFTSSAPSSGLASPVTASSPAPSPPTANYHYSQHYSHSHQAVDIKREPRPISPPTASSERRSDIYSLLN